MPSLKTKHKETNEAKHKSWVEEQTNNVWQHKQGSVSGPGSDLECYPDYYKDKMLT